MLNRMNQFWTVSSSEPPWFVWNSRVRVNGLCCCGLTKRQPPVRCPAPLPSELLAGSWRLLRPSISNRKKWRGSLKTMLEQRRWHLNPASFFSPYSARSTPSRRVHLLTASIDRFHIVRGPGENFEHLELKSHPLGLVIGGRDFFRSLTTPNSWTEALTPSVLRASAKVHGGGSARSNDSVISSSSICSDSPLQSILVVLPLSVIATAATVESQSSTCGKITSIM